MTNVKASPLLSFAPQEKTDESKQDVTNKRVTDDIVLDIGTGERIVGIEILDASSHVDLEKILPIQHEGIKTTV